MDDSASMIKLDRIDLKILMCLQADGRITNSKMADLVGLSPSPCLTRTKRLEEAGIIIGYRAKFNLAKLGDFATVFAQVTLQYHRRSEASRFERAVCRTEGVVEFHMVNGKYDYIIKFMTKDVLHYGSLMDSLAADNLGVASYCIILVNNMPIRDRVYPINK